MGTQQIFLIALAVLIISLMIFAGIFFIGAYLESSNREQIISNLYDVGLMAQTYYKKNVVSGGGGNSYTGWTIPNQIKNTQVGTFDAIIQSTRVDLSCDGKYIGRNGTSVVRVTARVDSLGVRIIVVN
jgi:hypothetical protein